MAGGLAGIENMIEGRFTAGHGKAWCCNWCPLVVTE